MSDRTTEGNIHAKWLRQAAAEISGEGYDGWGNTCLQAADEIDRLDREYLGALERLGVLQVQAGIRQQGAVYTKADAESLIAIALAADRARRSPEPRGEQMRRDLIAGICAAASGDMTKADAILDRYWPERPPMPEVRQMTPEEFTALVTGSSTTKAGSES